MKKIFHSLLAILAPMVPLTLQAQQFSQAIPDHINEIRVEDYARLMVTEGESASITSSTNTQVASVKGNRLLIGDNTNATITLPTGRSMTFVADDRSQIIFNGSFGKRPKLAVSTNDYSSAIFAGSLADSMWAVELRLSANDYSIIRSDIVLACYHFYFLAHDYARLDLACQKEKYEPGFESRIQSISQDENAYANWNYCYDDSIQNVNHEDKMRALVTKKQMVEARAARRVSEDNKKPSFWRHRDVALNFAWGFHNWGSEPLNGFGSVEGAASVRTSFNHLHLSINYPLIGTRHTGLYIGLGLDWDKYKFETPEVLFDAAGGGFVDGGQANCSSRLLTRYVVVPVTFRVDLWHDWHLSVSALPGLHWGGSHTGLRREYTTDLKEELQKDPSVNKKVNPYKLDLRASLNYEGVGLYLQVPTMSTMKEGIQELYPIKFGVNITID